MADPANVPWSFFFFFFSRLSRTKHLISTEKLIFSLESVLLGLALICLAFLFDGHHQVFEWLKAAAARLASPCVFRALGWWPSLKHAVLERGPSVLKNPTFL